MCCNLGVATRAAADCTAVVPSALIFGVVLLAQEDDRPVCLLAMLTLRGGCCLVSVAVLLYKARGGHTSWPLWMRYLQRFVFSRCVSTSGARFPAGVCPIPSLALPCLALPPLQM